MSNAADLARALKSLREDWPAPGLTQQQLATAFSAEKKITAATISAWETASSPKAPNAERLDAYARLFAARRVVDGRVQLVAAQRFTPEEEQRYRDLKVQLLGDQEDGEDHEQDDPPAGTLKFAEGPITVICPTTPQDSQGPLARADDPNFANLQRYADLDALMDIYGHLRAVNPTLDVFYQTAADVDPNDLSSHLIILGGIAWNQVTENIQEAVEKILPIRQVEVPDLKTGEIFKVDDEKYEPSWKTHPEHPDDSNRRVLAQDVAFLARLPNPFNHRRTLTICNGIHSRGVLGAVRCLTDPRVREANEDYLASRFPPGRFALLLRVRVVTNKTISPDLEDSESRLFEWPPKDAET